MGASNWVHLENCDVVRLTERAVLVKYDGATVWLPLSQIDDPDRLEEGDKGITVSITEWLANEKGLEGD